MSFSGIFPQQLQFHLPGISLLALSAVQGYHGYVLFVWLYGICLGGFSYSLKMFTLERVRARHFTKAWSFVQGAKSIPVLIGIPVTGYINQNYPKAGYYFSFVSTIIGASLMFLVGTRKTPPVPATTTNNCNVNGCKFDAMSNCVCPLVPYNNIYTPDAAAYGCRYDRIFPPNFEKSDVCRHSFKHKGEQRPVRYLPKSLSYAANIDYSTLPHRYPVHHEHLRCGGAVGRKNLLRPSKSEPEGLARWEYYRKPVIKNVQVIEQITTSV